MGVRLAAKLQALGYNAHYDVSYSRPGTGDSEVMDDHHDIEVKWCRCRPGTRHSFNEVDEWYAY